MIDSPNPMNEDTVDSTAPADEAPAVGDLDQVKGVLEAALLVAGEPVADGELAKLFEPPLPADTVRRILTDLANPSATHSPVMQNGFAIYISALCLRAPALM